MLPDFLYPYEEQIEKHKLNCITINATLLDNSEKLSAEQSKFLGLPFLPVGQSYPMDKKGQHMIMLAQINFSEVPQIDGYPNKGILQLFVSATNWYNEDDYSIIYHERTDLETQTDFAFLMPDLFEESPIYGQHKLTFTQNADYGNATDCRFNYRFEGKDFYNYNDTLTKEKQKELDDFFDGTGHKIGGYAFFTQTDPRDYSPNRKDDLLLLQIDTDEYIMFGDSGVAHVFINKNELKNLDFSKAYFHWDCC